MIRLMLRRTDKMLAKTFSAPTRSMSMQCLSSTNESFLNQKIDLIAELKMSKDIHGIKKMKVEKAKLEDKETYSDISSRQFTATHFVDQVQTSTVPDKDNAGHMIPDWKRQMLAKKAAERAKREFEERMAKEAEDRRLSAIPQWKRDLMARREEAETKFNISSGYTPKDDQQSSSRPVESWNLRHAVSIDNISFISCASNDDHSTNKDNISVIEHSQSNNNQIQHRHSHEISKNSSMENLDRHHENGNRPATHHSTVSSHVQHSSSNGNGSRAADEQENIIPWRAQLRKTNSRLSLVG